MALAPLLLAEFARAQIPMSAGSYAQSFDSLAASGSANVWTDNFTLSAWYVSKSASPNLVTNYLANAGSITTGSLYSFGASGSGNRALGLLVSSGVGNLALGLRFTNDTSSAQSNILISFTAEQWRSANTNAQALVFSYRIGTVLTNADAANNFVWTPFAPLNFTTPVFNGTTGALDGTATTNQTVFTNIPLAGVVVHAGQELFLRWYFARPGSGSSAGVAIDNLTVRFQAIGSSPPVITAQPQNEAAGEGGFALFTVAANGSPQPNFQWQCNGTNVPDATNSALLLTGLTTNQAGCYSAIMTNLAGATNSSTVTLAVAPTTVAATNGQIKFLVYNVAGNNSGAETNPAAWTTNAAQVQAIGRQLMFLKPDIVAFNEIPATNGVTQMPNWMRAFLPGYFLATNSVDDGYIQSVIASRFPITYSGSHLAYSSLVPFGGSGMFLRDLFEAQIAVPNWPLPLHVFVAHLKSTWTNTPQSDANKRAAMASAISNYLTTVFLPGTYGSQPYLLAGDMNEDAFYPEGTYVSGRPIQRLTSQPTGLRLTIPVNSVTHTDLTESIQSGLDTRFDYILPCALLVSNLAGSEVFRTDLLTNLPPNLFGDDDVTASDHLPVVMIFQNPFNTPFRLLSLTRTNQNVTLKWESQNNRSYCVEASSNLFSWMPFATNLTTSSTSSPFVFSTNNINDALKFFRIYRAP